MCLAGGGALLLGLGTSSLKLARQSRNLGGKVGLGGGVGLVDLLE